MSTEAILLKIKRDFTHDEAVTILQKELADAKFKIGELESEISELKYEKKPKEGKTAKQWKQDDFFKELKEQLNKTMLAKRDVNKERIVWQNKYFSLVSKVMKVAPELLEHNTHNQ